MREVGDRVLQRQRAQAHRVARNVVRDVDHDRAGSDALHDAVAHADELIRVAVVGEERERQHSGSRNGRLRVRQQRLDEAVDVVALRLDVDLQAVLARRLARDRSDRHQRAALRGNRSVPPMLSSRNFTVDELVKVT